MGPLYGIIMADYYLVRGKAIDANSLFDDRPSGRYYYRNGYNPKAIGALIVSGLLTIAFTVVPGLDAWSPFAWPIGVAVGALFYFQLCKVGERSSKVAATR